MVNSRKIDHIRIICKDPETDRNNHFFDDFQLIHRAFPEISFNDVDTSVDFLGKKLSLPLIISSMTGGNNDLIQKINRNLAIAAEETGVAMAVGSQRVMFSDHKSIKSFELRKYAPNAVLISNLGAVQFNYGFGLKEARKAVDVLEANALFLHLNPLQEIIQPNGNTNFSNLSSSISVISSGIEVPIILKEVGCGLSPFDIELGLKAGIKHFDIAGRGGTSWSRIESHRDKTCDTGIVFQDWGIPTPLALEMARPYCKKAKLIASGGIRNGIDILKSIVLGASIGGMASPFLKPAMDSSESVISLIESIRKEFIISMFLLGIKCVKELHLNKDLLWHK
ncbi:type 2 isopentenyl-diphosphate Delta-isomerase [Candidatus Liberibacter americanus]|uniref:Isopentenyl-diphosphate delta-isomerase n=1 Tax=Candidatus Liberibacter americanus str. Sao Paulo TaxID=1261131 RepID=U6B4S2_9HYPH|nr:type 2 isopentenyl-diphosphate Delta-isomerase [Candidatus Liberibacter americanus]AHA28069.1 L-lactate dehydrogenase [Candidatus Liberibacter americanus str. Sao Paulo]EMS35962.1 isopentenyl pyrophosphate isomerase [Candidatus Liberibacter americanus PW_SP]